MAQYAVHFPSQTVYVEANDEADAHFSALMEVDPDSIEEVGPDSDDEVE